MAELFGQAGISDAINESFDIEYLAELIVKECAGLFPAEYDTVDGKITIGKIIKNHFGVE